MHSSSCYSSKETLVSKLVCVCLDNKEKAGEGKAEENKVINLDFAFSRFDY